MMSKIVFDKKLKIVLCLLLFLGFSIIGLGIGILIDKILEVLFISAGLSFITIAILLIQIENKKY